MKKILTLLLTCIALAVSARAQIVAGASAGYLIDGKSGYYAARLGYQFKTATTFVHGIEAEIGYNNDSEQDSIGYVKATFMPVTLNYRAEVALDDSKRFLFYFGAGVGQAQVDWKVTINYGSSYYRWTSQSSSTEWTQALQVFSGVNFKVTEHTGIQLGFRYVRLGDIKVLNQSVTIGDDGAIELGINFKL